MEQLRGPVIPPVTAAGTDPAYIPGLAPPSPDRAGEEAADEEVEQKQEETTAGGAASEDAERTAGEPTGEPAGGQETGDRDEAEDEDGERDGEGGPAFEASDRRGSVAAGRFGVVFRLDGEEARFSWEEIGAVETNLPRFGRRFSVSVCTTARRWYEADVDAPSRKVLKEWDEEFDAVLDEWFGED
ncbi:hypothetical protein [Streptomyces sp. SS8]